MTDKQIITKDVDTSACKFFRHGICASPITLKCKLCTEISEKMCYYKQLKRKEQECEDMKKEIQQLKDELSQLQQLKDEDSLRIVQLVSELEQEKALKDTYFALYNTKHGDLADKYEYLEAENEKLKQYKTSKLASYESMQREWNEAVKENRELKQALYAIEMLVDEGRSILGGAGHYLAYLAFIKEVIQKINKVGNGG